jgi:hypothetical protein
VVNVGADMLEAPTLSLFLIGTCSPPLDLPTRVTG